MQGAAGQCVWKYACLCARYGFFMHACRFALKKKKGKNVHVSFCVCIRALWVYLRVSAACIRVFVCALAALCVSVRGRFVRAANT